ncbi:MAG: sugar nucleotide-binding protein [Gammaproteobacteria bacterium]|nr:sugar nucleotide-binding protein [Gammaproteobacteria bacterium]MDH5802923.1 sugar nucleotide-binding protein [Gammaproteobacteria bacterium]
MKTALILGISGNFGSHMAQTLARRGYAIRTLLRQPTRLPERFQGAQVFQGEVANLEQLRCAAEGAQIIVYGVNPANYRWDGVALPLLENAATVAEENQLTLLFPGNVYVFDPKDGPEFSETAVMKPKTSKGQIRLAMERRLQQAGDNGAQVIVMRMGDFISNDTRSSWLGHLLKPTKTGYQVIAAGRTDLTHTWAYLPDAAAACADILEMRQHLPTHNVFHFRGHRFSFDDLAQTVEQLSGVRVKRNSFPWLVLRLLAPFNTAFKGLVEMRYLWQQEVNLAEDALQRALGGQVPHTPLAEALVQTGLTCPVESPGYRAMAQ